MNTSSTGSALRRRDEILKVVRAAPVHSQEELAQRLARRGISVAQPTLSRDLKDLGLAKTSAGYAAPGVSDAPAGEDVQARLEERRNRVFLEFVLGVERAGTLVILKTPPAAAHPVARAIDEAGLDGTAGTIAGDDTIFIATPSVAAATRVARRLSAILKPAPRPRRARA